MASVWVSLRQMLKALGILYYTMICLAQGQVRLCAVRVVKFWIKLWLIMSLSCGSRGTQLGSHHVVMFSSKEGTSRGQRGRWTAEWLLSLPFHCHWVWACWDYKRVGRRAIWKAQLTLQCCVDFFALNLPGLAFFGAEYKDTTIGQAWGKGAKLTWSLCRASPVMCLHFKDQEPLV